MTELRSRGIQPDLIVCRSDEPLSDALKRKISGQCDVDFRAVINAADAANIYALPLILHDEGLDTVVCEVLRLDAPIDLAPWRELVARVDASTSPVRIGLIGKYVDLHDAYLSVTESLKHAGFHHGARVELVWIQAEEVEGLLADERLGSVDGIVIPGGFGPRGIEGKVRVLGPSIDQANRNGLAFVTLASSPKQARVGQFVQGSIDVGQRSVMSLPQSALVVRDGFTLVFQIDSQNRVRAHKVKAGAVVGDRVEILEGIAQGALDN
ncbi:MAG: synthase [Pseudomonadota bacterium]